MNVAKLPDLLKEIATKYLDGRQNAFWEHKQSGQWLIKHRDLEIAAGKAGIRFDVPTAYETDASKCVALLVTGRLGDAVEWSIGEASPKNTQQAYPYAMAEKRGKDRVILKLFGIHGHAYSDEEMPDGVRTEEQPAKSSASTKPALTASQKAARATDWLSQFAATIDQGMTAAETEAFIKENVDALRRAAVYPDLESMCADYLAVIGETV